MHTLTSSHTRTTYKPSRAPSHFLCALLLAFASIPLSATEDHFLAPTTVEADVRTLPGTEGDTPSMESLDAQKKTEKTLADKRIAARVAMRRQAEMAQAKLTEQAAEHARNQEALERQCIIKPVMTDAEITHCKRVWH